ncbi:hypothetical protein KCP73_24310 [Salmonella enterica subsp. enterica]|nr:hypothetical protein KCP73_24310 [Salmonella enterica subsp. enterica]
MALARWFEKIGVLPAASNAGAIVNSVNGGKVSKGRIPPAHRDVAAQRRQRHRQFAFVRLFWRGKP